jgi:hypothetical protein
MASPTGFAGPAGSSSSCSRCPPPSGKTVPLEANPTKYLSSTLRKPGAEYATVFAFDKPGCYMVDLARAKTKAKVRITAA